MSDVFPFLFYGTQPDDWFDDESHAWELRFKSAPSPDERDLIASAFEHAFARTTGEGRHDSSPPWLWSGEWALARVRVGSRAKKARKQLFAQMQEVLRAVHREVPLAAVSHLHAADISSNDPWEEWSFVRAPSPVEGPRWTAAVPMSGRREAAECREDRVFEETRARVRTPAPPVAAEPSKPEPTYSAKAAVRAAPDDDEGAEGSEPTARQAPARREKPEGKRVTLTAQVMPDDYQNPSPPPDVVKRFGGSTSIKKRPSGQWAGWVKRGKKEWVFAGERPDGSLFESDEVHKRPDMSFEISPDGRTALMLAERKRDVLEISLETGEVSEVGTLPRGHWAQAVALPGERVAASSWDTLALFKRTARGLEQIASYHYPDTGDLRAIDGGRVLFVMGWGDWSIAAIGLHKDDVRELGRLSSDTVGVEEMVVVDGKALLMDYDGKWHTLQGYEEAYKAAFEAGEAFPEPGCWDEEPTPSASTASDDDDASEEEEEGDADASSDDEGDEGDEEASATPNESAEEDEWPPAPAKMDDAEDAYNAGCDLKDYNDHTKAIDYFARAVELNADHGEAWHNLAVCHRAVGNTSEAESAFRRAVEVYTKRLADDASDYDAKFWRACVRCLLGDRDGALADLREAVEGGTYYRNQAATEADLESLRDDPEFQAITAKPKKATKKAAKKG